VQTKLPKSFPAINSARRDSREDYITFSNNLPTKTPISRGSICIPKNQTNKPTLVLDLDETLVHSSLTMPETYDHVLHIYIGGNLVDIFVKFRPYLFTFLREIAQLYEVIVFTSSVEIYADRLLDVIDPNNTLFHYRVFRDSCIQIGRHFIKDLDLLQRDLARTIIIDDSPKSYAYHKANGLPIKGYFGDDPHDDELAKVIPVLRKLVNATDVRLELGVRLDSVL
jgi:CTD small phosphatase-like protein 2